MQVSPSQLKSLLEALIPQRLPALITGAPGIGKSDIVEQAAESTGRDLLISHPVVEDPTDSKGLPFPAADGSAARFLPFGDLERVLRSTSPLLWFLDDLGQASTAVQAAKMQLLLARRIGEHKLPDHVTFVAATNRQTDNAGVSRILDPLKSRFATIVELKTSINDWTKWAVAYGVQPMLVAFLRFRPDLLSSDARGKGMANVHSPRSWGLVSKMMGVLPQELEVPAFNGAVGDAATEFLAFLQIARELPSPDAILASPHTANIPTRPAALFAIASALAAQATQSNFDRVTVYAERLIEAGHGEFAALLVRDAVRRNEEVSQSPAFIVAQGGPIGALIRGE